MTDQFDLDPRHAKCNELGHPAVTDNPWMDHSWCLCGQVVTAGDTVKLPKWTGGRLVSIYYSDDSVTLYHGDCLEITDWLTASVLVTDPPYGIAYKSNARRNNLERSIAGDMDASARDGALARFAGPALVFGTWRIQRPDRTRQVLIWDTKGALGMGAMDLPWKPSHQEIYVIGKGFLGRRDSDVLTVAPVQAMAANGRVHPHQKPVALMEALIAKCPVGVVADPFAGSGSTLVAAKAQGRRCIGVEIDERYCEAIVKRLAQGAFNFGDAS